MMIATVIVAHCSCVATAGVQLSLRSNLWEIVPRDDPVYDDLNTLADLGIIKLPERAYLNPLTRYDIADLIYRAGRELEEKYAGVDLPLDMRDGREIIAGLREEYADEIQWVDWAYSKLNSGEDAIRGLSSLGVFAGLDYGGVSSGSVAAPLPGSLSASAIAENSGRNVSFNIDPVNVNISDLAVNVAGSLVPYEEDDYGFRIITPYSLYPESMRGLKYRIDAYAESSGFQLRLSHSGTSSLPRDSLSVDTAQSEASAVYEIHPDVKLVAGMVVKSDQTGVRRESGVDLTFQVVPMYLSASLGLNISNSDTSDGTGIEDWRRYSTEVGLRGQYPISSEAIIRAAYSYLRYANSADRVGTILSTGVDYTPSPGTTVTAELEVKDDPESGISSVRGVGLGYQIDQDMSVMLNLFQEEEATHGANSESGTKWGAEFQWRFKF